MWAFNVEPTFDASSASFLGKSLLPLVDAPDVLLETEL